MNLVEGDRPPGLTALEEAFADALRGHPRLVLLESGDDPLRADALAELRTRAAEHDASVVEVAASGKVGGAHILQEAEEATGGRRGRGLPGWASRVLPDWLGALPVIGDLAAALYATARAVRRRRRTRAITGHAVPERIERLLAAATDRPLVVVLTDLQRASREDLADVELLLRVAREGTQLLVLVEFAPGPSQAWPHPRHLAKAFAPDQVRVLRREDPPAASVCQRVADAPGEVLEVLSAAADAGLEFDGEHVATLLKRPELYVEDQLATAIHLDLIEALEEWEDESGDIATRYRFLSPAVRAAVLDRRTETPSTTGS